ncbi:UDP-glycosyltransferase 83A1 [Apostasia shenzhenica]|uniref:UDP-glycosyltransferase 83A1 n=1 Tax=Apostasia shenzhenica TaxID=1088818 RepID=A0A2I0AWF6_9ASPA|nr:UDP-glycosyltransferase 83A1 [Apostasia shenzhenica]
MAASSSPPHALILPYPAQSHVIALLELSYYLIDRGFTITFLNTQFNHDRLLAVLKFTCFVADESVSWAFDVAKKLNLRSAAFFPAAAAVLATNFSIPQLILDGIIDEEGELKHMGEHERSAGTAAMDAAKFYWNCFADKTTRRVFFHYIVSNNRAVAAAEFIICNTFQELESPALSQAPNILPVGPLLSGCRPGRPSGFFWPPETDCLRWLDQQPLASVVYVAFGSHTIFTPVQFQELALGLELTGRPFLLVVRPDITDVEDQPYPARFVERVAGGRGKVVGWSPQQQVLSHRSIACFVTHCGWNSTLEGVRNGVPFLCWPQFCDQFFNESYICDVWRTGVRMERDENGIISKEKIASKVEELLGDGGIKARSSALKEKALRSIEEGGSSFENLNRFAEAMKDSSRAS